MDTPLFVMTAITFFLFGFLTTVFALWLCIRADHEVGIYKKTNSEDPNGVRHLTVAHQRNPN